MTKKELLTLRLTEIANSVEHSVHALALIALGSGGPEIGRLDNYSDLDFFVIVENGYKNDYLNDLNWLKSVSTLVFQYRNTIDGYKILFQDRVFCEFAVFEKHELSGIPFAQGRVIWKRNDVEESIATPAKDYSPHDKSTSVEWLLGEVLTNLYVGLSRYCRGEMLSATKLVQEIAVSRVIELYELSAGKLQNNNDPFASERRIEQRYPEFASMLPKFIPGYKNTRGAAKEILSYLSMKYPLNGEMYSAILELCECEC